MTCPRRLTRRHVLRSSAAIPGLAVAGCVGDGDDEMDAATDDDAVDPADEDDKPVAFDIRSGDFADAVQRWAWFPTEEALWSRAAEPFDFQDGERRWLAVPTEEGSVRCRVEHDEAPGNAGVYVDLGRLGEIERIELDVETTRSDGNAQQLLVAIYLDTGGDGDYFEWEPADGREAFVSLGGDAELVGVYSAAEPVTIEVDTQLDLIPPAEERLVTVDELQRETIEGVTAVTGAAIQISVVGSGPGNVEEAIIHDVEVTSQQAAEEAWAMSGHDYSNTSRNRGSVGPTAAVDPAWTFETDGAVRSSAAVVDGTVYVGSDDGTLYAIEAAAGEVAWAYQTDGPIRSSPAVLGRTVYVGSDDGYLHAVSIHTGESRWKLETGDRVRGSPTVEANTGALDTDDHIVAVGSDDGSMYVCDTATGELVVSFPSDGRVVGAPMVYYIQAGTPAEWTGFWELAWGNSDGNEYAWIPEAPSESARFQALPRAPSIHAGPAAPRSTAAPGRGRLDSWYIPGTDALRKFSGTGNADWTVETNGEIRASPAIGSRQVFLGSWDGSVYALDPSSGEEQWRFETGGKVDASPSLAGGSLYVSSHDGRVYAITTDGESLWSFDTGAAVRTSPVVAERAVYVGSDDGAIYALEASSSRTND